MAEVEKAKAILEAERAAVLGELRKWKAREDKIRQREVLRRTRAEEEMHSLLMRGKAAGVPVVEMADGLRVTRQMAHRIIREAEHDRPFAEQRKAAREGRKKSQRPEMRAAERFFEKAEEKRTIESVLRSRDPAEPIFKRKGGGGDRA